MARHGHRFPTQVELRSERPTSFGNLPRVLDLIVAVARTTATMILGATIWLIDDKPNPATSSPASLEHLVHHKALA